MVFGHDVKSTISFSGAGHSTNQSLLSSLMLVFNGEATNTSLIVFSLTRSGLEPTIYRLEASTLINTPLMLFDVTANQKGFELTINNGSRYDIAENLLWWH